MERLVPRERAKLLELDSDDKNQVCLRETVRRRNIMVRFQDEKITQ